ncbi:hypothetical protein [uncultured Tenacibaculum sp.]|uniref:hypothetical protein n=1 Tax=uncultured Tenacibaculum sp. TaxID=174713 RepID=UPI002629F556|nr:hypothetical protein [uncultured Tenacibaculum sp.]
MYDVYCETSRFRQAEFISASHSVEFTCTSLDEIPKQVRNDVYHGTSCSRQAEFISASHHV